MPWDDFSVFGWAHFEGEACWQACSGNLGEGANVLLSQLELCLPRPAECEFQIVKGWDVRLALREEGSSTW
jgi:hypothetical protein